MKKLISICCLALIAACASPKDGVSSLIITQFDAALCSGTGGSLISIGSDTNRNGALEASEVTQTSLICNGKDNLDEIVLINPCGSTMQHDEILLRMPDGSVLASFSNTVAGEFTRLTLLVDGASYMTTDTGGCTFSLSTTGNIRSYMDSSGMSLSWEMN